MQESDCPAGGAPVIEDGDSFVDHLEQGLVSRVDYSPATKRSLTIAGHSTSLRLETFFWDALVAESRARGLPVNALVARIDVERLAIHPAPNLASAIRLWLFAQARLRQGN